MNNRPQDLTDRKCDLCGSKDNLVEDVMGWPVCSDTEVCADASSARKETEAYMGKWDNFVTALLDEQVSELEEADF